MTRCDKVTATACAFLMLVVAPYFIIWDINHPESRRPGLAYDPCVYLPCVAVAYGVVVYTAVVIFRDLQRIARRRRVKELIAQTEALIRQGRRDEARKTIALAAKLFREQCSV